MKKWLIIFCLFIFPAFAQEISDNTFREDNPNLILDNQARTFNGNSFVYIQGISDRPQPKTWMDNVKVRLFGSMEIPNKDDSPYLTENSSFKEPSKMKIGVLSQDFFGSKKELKYTPHTSNWDFIIQPMDNKTISIQENIQFLLTEDTQIIRSWPISKDKLFLIKAQIDNHYILPDKNEKETLLDFSVLSPGLHQIRLQYIISLPIHDGFVLPLTSDTWPLITDAFSGIILNGKIKFKDLHFLLGENQQEIPENFIFQTDEQGNIFFRNSHILPPFTLIRLFSNTSDIAPNQDENAPFSISGLLTFIVTCIVIFLYLILSGCEIHFASLTYLLKRFNYITSNSTKCWLHRMGEIVIGCLIILFITFLITFLVHIHLSYIYWILLIILTITGIVLLDRLVFYPKQKMIYQLHQNKERK